MSIQPSDAGDASRHSPWISTTLTFGLGSALGAALVLLGAHSPPAAQLIALAKPIEMVLVMQTATPALLPVGQPTTEASAPQPTELPSASISETLQGAPEYARLGSPNAPIQLVVFADPQCPFCRKQALETEPQLVEQFVKTGKAALTYRHFTFLGAESQRIAGAMACAGAQGADAFWKFHQHVFEHQFPENSGMATDAALKGWANAVHLDEKRFSACLTDSAARAQVDADNTAGQSLHVTGTPTLFVNGRPMPGALPFDFIKTAIETELSR